MITMSLQSDDVVLDVYLVRVTIRNIIDFTFLFSGREMGSLNAMCGIYCKKSLKIPKGQSVYRRTNNTMAKKKKVQKDKQRSAKHTYKTKDRVTRIPLKTGSERRCSGRESSSCSTSGTRRVHLVTD